MSGQYWFRPKSFGYGATPTTWQGWLVIFGAAAMIALSVFVAISAQTRQWYYWLLIDLVCLLVAVASLAAMVHIARLKTDGEWRWRWRY